MLLLFSFLGLFLGLILNGDNLIVIAVLAIFIFIFALIRFNKKLVIFYSAFLALGVLISFIDFDLNKETGEYIGIVLNSKNNYCIVISRFRKYIIYEENNSYEFLDVIKFKGNLSNLIDNSLESEFSFTKYLNTLGVKKSIQIESKEYIFKNFIQLKAFKNYFLNLFSDSSKNYIDAFLFNVRNSDDYYIKTASNLNLIILFSSTGIYLSFLFRIVEYLFYIKFNKKNSKILTLVFLSYRVVFSFSKIGVRRLIYFKIFSLFNEYKFNKKFTSLEMNSIVGLLMLLINPFLAKQQGFYLSFFIIIVLYFLKDNLKEVTKYKYIKKISIFLFLFMLPISINSNNEFHYFSLLFNILFTPITFIYSLFASISLYSYPIKPLFDFMSGILNGILLVFNKIDFYVYIKTFNSFYLVIYYFLLLLIMYEFETKNYKKISIYSMSFAFVLALNMIPINRLYLDKATFINVGQGDSFLMQNHGTNILIDTGGLSYKDIATNVTIPYLKKNLINKIDYVFISHSDNDHCGALESLKKNFRVLNVCDTDKPFKIKINSIEFENINKWSDEFEDVNDKSQVLKFTFLDKKFLFMGDASTNIENKIMNEYSPMNIDILKVGHHGSNTSSSYDFLKFVNPKEAVISVGLNNKYKHPSDKVIDNLNNLNIKYHRTDLEGSIIYQNFKFINYFF